MAPVSYEGRRYFSRRYKRNTRSFPSCISLVHINCGAISEIYDLRMTG
jgi:hypothetical protein